MEGWFWNQFRVSESESHSVMSNFLWSHGLYSPCNFPGQNTGVGSLSLLQGIFPTQESNPGLSHCWQILYQLSHRETKPNKLVKGKTRQIIIFKLKVKNVQCNQRLKRKKKRKVYWLFETILVTDHQVPLSTEFPKQECWSGLPFPSPGDLPDPGTELESSAWQKHCLSTQLPD